MEAMQEQEILQAFLKLMEENSRKEQAQDLTLLLSYLRDMEHQLDAVVNELHTVKRELAEQKAGLNPAGRREVSAKVKQLEGSAYHLFEQIEKLRNHCNLRRQCPGQREAGRNRGAGPGRICDGARKGAGRNPKIGKPVNGRYQKAH